MLGDAVIVDLDKNTFQTEYNDIEALPSSTVADLKKKLKGQSLLLWLVRVVVVVVGESCCCWCHRVSGTRSCAPDFAVKVSVC